MSNTGWQIEIKKYEPLTSAVMVKVVSDGRYSESPAILWPVANNSEDNTLLSTLQALLVYGRDRKCR